MTAPVSFTYTSTLPSHVGGIPDVADLDGVQALATMAKLLGAIDQAPPRTAPDPDCIPYKAYKNMRGLALMWLLKILNAVWMSGEVSAFRKHS